MNDSFLSHHYDTFSERQKLVVHFERFHLAKWIGDDGLRDLKRAMGLRILWPARKFIMDRVFALKFQSGKTDEEKRMYARELNDAVRDVFTKKKYVEETDTKTMAT